MPEVKISIGGRTFDVACQEGEEHYLQAAAKLLDHEATTLTDQIGRMPEPQMLLMAGLMLADKTAGLEEKLGAAQEAIRGHEGRISELENAPKPEPEKIEVAVLPDGVVDTFAEIAARAESIAESLES